MGGALKSIKTGFGCMGFARQWLRGHAAVAILHNLERLDALPRGLLLFRVFYRQLQFQALFFKFQ